MCFVQDDISRMLPLRWRAHRAKEEPAKGVFAIAIIVVAGFAAAIFMDSLWWGIFAVCFLFLGLARFFLPIEYAADGTGIRERFLGVERVASWRSFRRAVVVGREVLLSPYPRKSFLDRFRGWSVRAPDEKTAAVLAELVKLASQEGKCAS